MSTKSLSDRIREAEQVLQGLPLVDLGLQCYDPHGKVVFSPTYLLPIVTHQYQSLGCFVKNNQLCETKIGFMHEKEDKTINFYRPNLQGDLLKLMQDADTVYLPLKLTSLQRDSPNYIFGVHGLNGIFPIMYFQETEKEIIYYRLYKNIDGNVKSEFILGEPDANKATRDIFREMVQGKVRGLQLNKTTEKPEYNPVAKIINDGIDWRKPKSIKESLKTRIIGQEEGKKTLASGFSDYMGKVQTKDPKIRKSNIIIVGPTGVGKTLTARIIAEKAGLPFAYMKLTGKTAAGYYGGNIESTLKDIRLKTGEEEAPQGVVFLDEIDKKALWREKAFGDEIQDQIIGLSEGDTIHFDKSNQGAKEKPLAPMKTDNLMFIIGGAFSRVNDRPSLTEISRESALKEEGKEIGIGFNRDPPAKKTSEDTIYKATPADIIKYRFKEDFIGRFPIIAQFYYLNTEDKIKILTEVEDSIWVSHMQLSKWRGLNIKTSPEIPKIIAEACPKETGARGLETICSTLFSTISYDPERFMDKKGEIYLTPEIVEEILDDKDTEIKRLLTKSN